MPTIHSNAMKGFFQVWLAGDDDHNLSPELALVEGYLNILKKVFDI